MIQDSDSAIPTNKTEPATTTAASGNERLIIALAVVFTVSASRSPACALAMAIACYHWLRKLLDTVSSVVIEGNFEFVDAFGESFSLSVSICLTSEVRYARSLDPHIFSQNGQDFHEILLRLSQRPEKRGSHLYIARGNYRLVDASNGGVIVPESRKVVAEMRIEMSIVLDQQEGDHHTAVTICPWCNGTVIGGGEVNYEVFQWSASNFDPNSVADIERIVVGVSSRSQISRRLPPRWMRLLRRLVKKTVEMRTMTMARCMISASFTSDGNANGIVNVLRVGQVSLHRLLFNDISKIGILPVLFLARLAVQPLMTGQVYTGIGRTGSTENYTKILLYLQACCH